MKYTTLKALAILGLFVMLPVASVSAQSNSNMRVNIPFDFAAGKAQLKAGEYIVRRSSENILVVRGINERTDTLIFAPNTVQRPEADRSGKLVFRRYGNEYFLAEVWTTTNPIGREVSLSGSERRRARELTKTKARPEFVEIAALIR